MLLLPELFVPKRPVMGASRIASTDFHNLKFLRVSSLSTVMPFSTGGREPEEPTPPLARHPSEEGIIRLPSWEG